MQAVKSTNIEKRDSGLSPEILGEIINHVGKACQNRMLDKVKRGPMEVCYSDYDVTVTAKTKEAFLTIEGSFSDDKMDSLIDELEKQGFLTRDGDTLIGLGEYAEVEMTGIEEQVLSALKSAYGRTMTAMGVRRKMKDSWISTERVQEVLEGLANKNYVEEVEVTEAGSTLYTAL
jgi:hypothetical protein